MTRPVVTTRSWTSPLAGVYGTYGAFWGVFGVVFSDLVRDRGLTYASVGTQLAVLSAVAVGMMLFAAQPLEMLPRRMTVGGAIVVSGVGVALLALVPTWALVVAFVITGAGTGLVDVFVNAAGHEAEQRSGRPVLQVVHAAYGAGAGVGALATGIALDRGLGYGTALLVMAVLQVVSGVDAWLRVEELRTGIRQRRRGVSLSALVAAPILLVPALVLTAAYFVEGSIGVWGVVYLREELGTSAQEGSYGLAAFSFAVAFGRMFAARVLFRFGPITTLMVSGTGALAAGAVAVLVPSPVAASAAFLVVGFCIAASGPAAIGLAGRAGIDIGIAIAAISIVGYTGFIVGPPALGALADLAGIRATMAVILAASVGIVIGGALAPRREAGEGRDR